LENNAITTLHWKKDEIKTKTNIHSPDFPTFLGPTTTILCSFEANSIVVKTDSCSLVQSL